jgi:hypothetical protein
LWTVRDQVAIGHGHVGHFAITLRDKVFRRVVDHVSTSRAHMRTVHSAERPFETEPTHGLTHTSPAQSRPFEMARPYQYFLTRKKPCVS